MLPDRAFFRIGEVARHLGLPAYTLRYWERRIPALRPERREGGRRLYGRREVDLLMRIRRMIEEEGYSLAGVRKALSRQQRRGLELPLEEETAAVAVLRKIRRTLEEISTALGPPDATGRSAAG